MKSRVFLVVVVAFALAGAGGAARARPGAAAKATPGAVFVIRGHGWGHGIGLSQYGAYGFAKHGWRYKRIATHYFPKTVVTKAPVSRIRVLLTQGRRELTISSKAAFRVRDGKGKNYRLAGGSYKLGPALKVNVDDDPEAEKLAGPLLFQPGQVPVTLGRPYRGSIQVDVVRGLLRAINFVGLEQYLYGVVPHEVPYTWPADALKAQALVARSYTLSTRKSGAFDVYADPRSQAYGGVDLERFSTTAAVDATAGEVLAYKGQIVVGFYFSTSGGRTAAIQDIWPNARPVPYLVSVPDPYDTESPYHDWGPIVYRAKDLAKRLHVAGRLVDVRTTINPSRRVSRLTAVGTQGRARYTGQEVRDVLGLRSSWFRVAVLSLVRPAGPLTHGDSLDLKGFARGFKSVRLEQRPYGKSWADAGRVKPARDGTLSIPVAPKISTEYRLAAGRIRGGLATVRVAPRIRLASPPAGSSLEGTVRPALRGAAVTIERLAGTWTPVASGTVAAGGRFRVRLRVTSGLYRARVAAQPGFATAFSPPLRIVS